MSDELQEVQEEQPQAEESVDTSTADVAGEPSAEGDLETSAEAEETAGADEMGESEESDQGEDSADEGSSEL
jgi:hypothetical protein